MTSYAATLRRIKEALDASGKSQADLARHLGLDRSQITRILSGARKLRVDELEQVLSFCGLESSGGRLRSRSGAVMEVRVHGEVHPGRYARRDHEAEPRTVGAVAHAKFPPERQHAFDMGVATADGRFAPGDVLLCVPFAAARTAPLQGDLLVIETASDHLLSYDLASLNGPDLVSQTTGATVQLADGVRIHSLVIALHRSLE